MMKTLYIHIGTPKTGSTSLQTFFQINKKPLKQKGIYYPTEGSYYHDDASHQILAYELNGDYSRRMQLHREIRQHINETECHNILLSAERFWYVSGKKIRAIFDNIPLRYKIIVYLRRQDNRLISVYNQRVKQCRKEKYHDDLDNFIKIQVENKNSSFYHYPRMTQLAEAFGKENIIVRPFEKQQWFHQNLIEDFLSLLGLSLTQDFEKAELKNESLPYELISLMELFNRQSHLKKEQQFQFSWRLRHLPFEMELQNYDPLSPQLRREILDFFQADNEAVAHDFLGREDGQLFYEPLPNRDEAWEPYSGLFIEKVAKATVKIWQLEENKRQNLLKQIDTLTQDIQNEKAVNQTLELENQTLIDMLIKSH